MSDMNRNPKGIPTGGRFANSHKPESNITLSGDKIEGLPTSDELEPFARPDGRYGLKDSRTGQVIFGGRDRKSWATPEAATEWAQVTYPLVAKVASSVPVPARSSTPASCPQCHSRNITPERSDTSSRVENVCDDCGYAWS